MAECPICLESASDDPVLTPCAHRMCRECLLSSWWTPAGGPCPICRRPLTKADLITCPSAGRFQVDVEENWKESSKVAKLIECLERIRRSGEKCIVFSQWTGFLDLLEIALRKRFGFLRYDGKLNQQRREQVLKEFNERKDKIVSIQCFLFNFSQQTSCRLSMFLSMFIGATYVTESWRSRLESHCSF